MFDRRHADMFGHVCLFGSGGPLACLVMFKQTCWELWSLLHMAHWHVYILFDSLTCTMTCQVKQMIGIVSWAKVPWQKLQTKVVSTSCFEMSWWGSLEVKADPPRTAGLNETRHDIHETIPQQPGGQHPTGNWPLQRSNQFFCWTH